MNPEKELKNRDTMLLNMNSNLMGKSGYLSLKTKTLLLVSGFVSLSAIAFAQEGPGGLGGSGAIWEWTGISSQGLLNFADQVVLFRIQSPRDLFIFLSILVGTSMPAYIAIRRGFKLLNANINQFNSSISRGEHIAVLLMSLATGYLTATLIGFWFAGTILLLAGIGAAVLGPLAAYRYLDQATGGNILPDGGTVPDGGDAGAVIDSAAQETTDLDSRVSETRSEESQGASEDRIISELEVETQEAQDIVEKLENAEHIIETNLDGIKNAEDKMVQSEERDKEELERIQSNQSELMQDISTGEEVTRNRGLSDEVISDLETDFSNEMQDLRMLNDVLDDQAVYVKKIRRTKPQLDEEQQRINELESEIQNLRDTEKELEGAEKKAEGRAATAEEESELGRTEEATSQIEQETERLEQRRQELSRKLETGVEELESEAQELRNEIEEVETIARELRQEDSDLHDLRDMLRNASGNEVEELESMIEDKIQLIENVETKAGKVVDNAEEALNRF